MLISIHLERHSHDPKKQSEQCLSQAKFSQKLFGQCLLYTSSMVGLHPWDKFWFNSFIISCSCQLLFLIRYRDSHFSVTDSWFKLPQHLKFKSLQESSQLCSAVCILINNCLTKWWGCHRLLKLNELQKQFVTTCTLKRANTSSGFFSLMKKPNGRFEKKRISRVGYLSCCSKNIANFYYIL